MTIDQVANYLSCDRRKIGELIKHQRLDAFDISAPQKKHRMWRITVAALETFMTQHVDPIDQHRQSTQRLKKNAVARFGKSNSSTISFDKLVPKRGEN